MAVRMRSALVALTLVAAVARAEGVDSRQKLPDTAERMHGVVTAIPMPGGGFVTLGGSTLRVLRKGGRSLEVLHRQPGDNLYRVSSNEAGAVLASWEKDPYVHYFTATKKHVTLPTPQPPSPDVYHFHVEYLAFLPGGRDALVYMEGRRQNQPDINAAYRVPLDGKRPPELLYAVDGAVRLEMTRDVALYLMPRNPGRQACEARTCNPVAELFAMELTPGGVRKTVLVDGARTPLGNARMVWGSGEGLFVLQLDIGRNERAVLRWRPGEPKADVRPFPKFASFDEELRSTKSGDVLQLLVRHEDSLTLRRHRPDGTEQVATLPASQHPDEWDQKVYAVGERKDGRLWLHWGDSLLLFSHDFKRTPLAYNLKPLLPRRSEWAGHSIYLPDPEVLWVGVEVGRGRDYVRLTFADIEQRAKPWAPYRDGSRAGVNE